LNAEDDRCGKDCVVLGLFVERGVEAVLFVWARAEALAPCAAMLGI